MQAILPMSATLVTSYLLAGSAILLLRSDRPRRAALGVVIIPFVVASLYFIPAAVPAYRAVAAIFVTDLTFKLIDCARQRRANRIDVVSRPALLQFLIPIPAFQVLLDFHDRWLTLRPRLLDALREIFLGTCGCVAGIGVLIATYDIGPLRSCFPLEHVVKACTLLFFVCCLARLIFALEHLAGFDPLVPIRNPFLSRTPADFWSRWNCRVQAWFHFNVFLPVGGKRLPVRGVLLTFFASGLLHELMFGIATSRFAGYQFAFFTIQGPAVLFSRRLERFAQRNGSPGKAVAHAVTVCWMLLTSVLFCHGVDQIFPFFYVSEPWLE
jgi:hypothetical protein